jgi:hypothetical protein
MKIADFGFFNEVWMFEPLSCQRLMVVMSLFWWNFNEFLNENKKKLKLIESKFDYEF